MKKLKKGEIKMKKTNKIILIIAIILIIVVLGVVVYLGIKNKQDSDKKLGY